MILLRLISWPYVQKHLARTLLTVAGIVLGVAVFVGMHTANQSVVHAFYQTIDRIAGKTQLQITAGEPGFPEEILERVQSRPEVRVAVPVIEAVVEPPYRDAGSLLILAVDMTGDRSLRDYDFESGDESIIEDPLIFLAQSDSLIVASTFAEQHGLSINSKLQLNTMEGPKQFTIRGIMKPGGLTSAFGGSLAVMDVYSAQKVFGRGRRFDRIDLAVQDGIRVEDAQRNIQQVLGAGFQVEAPNSRGEQFENLSQIYAMTANITSLFALFIGVFIIFNTFSIAVTAPVRDRHTAGTRSDQRPNSYTFSHGECLSRPRRVGNWHRIGHGDRAWHGWTSRNISRRDLWDRSEGGGNCGQPEAARSGVGHRRRRKRHRSLDPCQKCGQGGSRSGAAKGKTSNLERGRESGPQNRCRVNARAGRSVPCDRLEQPHTFLPRVLVDSRLGPSYGPDGIHVRCQGRPPSVARDPAR